MVKETISKQNTNFECLFTFVVYIYEQVLALVTLKILMRLKGSEFGDILRKRTKTRADVKDTMAQLNRTILD